MWQEPMNPGNWKEEHVSFPLKTLFNHIAVNSIEFYMFILGRLSTSLALGI
jgi:hypothetical protein